MNKENNSLVWAFGGWLYVFNLPLFLGYIPAMLTRPIGLFCYCLLFGLCAVRYALPVVAIRGSTLLVRTLLRTRRIDVGDIVSVGWGKFGQLEITTKWRRLNVFRVSRFVSHWKQWGRNPQRMDKIAARFG